MSGLFDLVQFNVIPLGIVLLIGIAAGRWMFRRPPAGPDGEDQAQP